MVFIKLPAPNIKKDQMGHINVSITVTNYIDQILAERGFIPESEIRTVVLDNVLVDTGASLLSLPTAVIEKLGLKAISETIVNTAGGEKATRIFKDANLTVCGRNSTFDCIELTDIDQPLLGVIPLERLGLQPDLQSQTLITLPTQSGKTYLYA